MSYGDVGLGAQFSGSILAVLGAFAGASAQKASLHGQAEIAAINASTADEAARSALFAGQVQEQRSMLATANLKSTQQASFASRGIDLGEGSAARVLTSTDTLGAIDHNTIAANAVRQAWGYRTQATNFENEARSRQSASDSVSPWLAAGTSLLNGATSVASNWYALDKAGALDTFGTKSRSGATGDFARFDRGQR